MIFAFAMLFVGGVLLGGVWSFLRAGRPWWMTLLLAVAAVICLLISFWRIQQAG